LLFRGVFFPFVSSLCSKKTVQDLLGHLLGLSAAFFGRTDTRGASFLTGAGVYGLLGVFEKPFFKVKERRAQSYPAREVVINKDVRLKGNIGEIL
jgi:hypothetical protein